MGHRLDPRKGARELAGQRRLIGPCLGNPGKPRARHRRADRRANAACWPLSPQGGGQSRPQAHLACPWEGWRPALATANGRASENPPLYPNSDPSPDRREFLPRGLWGFALAFPAAKKSCVQCWTPCRHEPPYAVLQLATCSANLPRSRTGLIKSMGSDRVVLGSEADRVKADGKRATADAKASTIARRTPSATKAS